MQLIIHQPGICASLWLLSICFASSLWSSLNIIKRKREIWKASPENAKTRAQCWKNYPNEQTKPGTLQQLAKAKPECLGLSKAFEAQERRL
jgi:hypothetical protein